MTATWNSPKRTSSATIGTSTPAPRASSSRRGPSGKIFFAKSWAYSLFAAPFVRVFGINGFLVFHAVLLLLLLLMGFAYFSLV